MMRVLNLVIISKNFGDLEERLLRKNIVRAYDIFDDIRIAYVLSDSLNARACLSVDASVRVLLIENPIRQRNAALSRAVGFEALGVGLEEMVLFLDGDMLVSRSYLGFLRDLDAPKFLCMCNRVDIWDTAGEVKRRGVHFNKGNLDRFKKLYGSMAIRGIDFLKFNLMTHDLEEQWFLLALRFTSVPHFFFPYFGIFHFDRFTGIRRKLRVLVSSRGVGLWQGLFRDPSLPRMTSEAIFILGQKDGLMDLLKFLTVSTVSLPKLLLYRMPKRLRYKEIKCVKS